MAYYDNNGRITIDENVAWQDIHNIQSAIEQLNSSKAAIDNLIRQADSEAGLTSRAIVEKALQLKKQIDDSINRLDETVTVIRKTVYRYQEIDRKVRDAIRADGCNVGGGGIR